MSQTTKETQGFLDWLEANVGEEYKYEKIDLAKNTFMISIPVASNKRLFKVWRRGEAVHESTHKKECLSFFLAG